MFFTNKNSKGRREMKNIVYAMIFDRDLEFPGFGNSIFWKIWVCNFGLRKMIVWKFDIYRHIAERTAT